MSLQLHINSLCVCRERSDSIVPSVTVPFLEHALTHCTKLVLTNNILLCTLVLGHMRLDPNDTAPLNTEPGLRPDARGFVH